jgi:tetratricopeptide (TPR) repeat protein
MDSFPTEVVVMSRSLFTRLVPVLVLLAALGACRKQTADDHAKKAEAYLAQSQPKNAIVEYRLALQVDPKRGDIRTKLADLYMKNQDLADALKEYVRAADLLPNDAQAQVKAGNLLLVARAFEDAKSRAKKALAVDPKNVDAEILLGNAMAGLKDVDGAISQYQEAIALNPSQDAAYANLGAIQFSKGDKEEAEASFRKAVEVAPKSVPAHMALANFLWATGRRDDAEQALKDALALDPSNLTANRALGVFYLATNRAPEAEPYFKAIAKAANTPAAQIGLADYYVAVQRYDDARKVLSDLALRQGSYAAATTRLAAIDAAQGQRAHALSRLHDVLAKEPKNLPARLLNARLLFADNKPTEALAGATSIVTDQPNAPEADGAYFLIGSIQATLDRPDQAIKAYEQVLRREQQPLAAELALAALTLSIGQADKAENYAQQALTLNPDNPASQAMMVRVHLAERKNDQAARELAELARKFPNAPPVLDLLAAQAWSNGRLEDARAAYTKVLAASPRNIEAMTGLVRLDLAAHRTEDAVKLIDDGLKTAEPSGDLLMLAARTYATTGDSARAEALLKQAIELQPARLQAYSLLGGLYISQHRLDDAEAQFEAVVARNPQSVPAHTMLGMLLDAQGRAADAMKQYQKVLAINPDAAVAANNLAWLYVAGNQNLDQALQLAQTAHRALPNEPHVNDTLGWIYYQKKMGSSAVDALESSVKEAPNDPSTRYHLGMAYLQTGDIDKGREALQRALAISKDFDGAADARKTLAGLGS